MLVHQRVYQIIHVVFRLACHDLSNPLSIWAYLSSPSCPASSRRTSAFWQAFTTLENHHFLRGKSMGKSRKSTINGNFLGGHSMFEPGEKNPNVWQITASAHTYTINIPSYQGSSWDTWLSLSKDVDPIARPLFIQHQAMINADGKSGWDLDPVVNDLIGHGYPNTGLDRGKL